MAKIDLSNLIITKVTSAALLYNNVSVNPTLRYNRNEWGIILKLEGKTVYNCNGKEYISDSLHPVILPMGIDYSWHCIEAGKFIAINFKSEKTGTDIIPINIRENNTILKYFHKIEKSRTIKNKTYGIENVRDVYNILLFLLENDQNRYSPSTKINMLKPAVDYIVENYNDTGITNDRLASLCNISTVYFRKTFEAVYGTSPIAYLNNIRISRAKDMLKSDYDSITNIAESVGYNSIYHFSKMFKKYTGKNPSEYAKRVQ